MKSGHISASLCLHMHPCTSTDWFSLSIIYEGKDSVPQLNLHATSLAKSSKGKNKLVVPSLNLRGGIMSITLVRSSPGPMGDCITAKTPSLWISICRGSNFQRRKSL